ncbi:MAG TPA: hypothetical protein PK364_05555 [Synergistaceae bacterium]|nr:hypothetical protein [Synergistaceae bacterium]HPJ26121.1 hypothetical protein [Synergistaceae bacterium]HPQ36626.1 hypothetical protein [Synergistaceae bacterium]
MQWKKKGVCGLFVLVMLFVLFGSSGWAEGNFSYHDVKIIPLTSNIFRCTGTITNETEEYFQGACFNLSVKDMNGQVTKTMMFCFEKINPRASHVFVQDFESENRNFETEITFLTSY